jgi:NAD(P)-dependent dehydrogenase (short-subunit alcohol dehydrogenase family)
MRLYSKENEGDDYMLITLVNPHRAKVNILIKIVYSNLVCGKKRAMQANYFGVLGWIEFWEKPCQERGKINFVATSSINAIFAPPRGSAYSASKAAIVKAFESLALTYFGTNLRFSVVYPGPVDTAGLKAPKKLPFTWTAEKMGKCIVDFALSNKSSCEPFFFYKIITRLLRALPTKYTMKLLGKI